MDNKKMYSEYLKKSGLSVKTFEKYYFQVPDKNNVQDLLARHCGTRDLYSVSDVRVLERIVEEIRLQEYDIVGNRMYSCGVKKYISFLISKI